jgi:hypothetical protein
MCLIPASFASSRRFIAPMGSQPSLIGHFFDLVSRYFGEIGAKWLEPQWWAYGLYLFLF